MTLEFETPITIQQGKEILRATKNAHAKAKNETRVQEFEDASLRLKVLEGDLCASCEHLRLFKRTDQGTKKVSMRCTEGYFPVAIYKAAGSTEPECSIRVPIKGR